MAGSGSYARGDQPRSVPDDLKAPYEEMAQRQKAYNARQEAMSKAGIDWAEHPGAVESMVPVWGSAREAIADYHEGDMVGAVANGALALTDLTGEGYVLKSLGKGGLKVAGSHAWKGTRKWMGHEGKKLLEKGQHGHHWLIPRNDGWGKAVPSDEVHARMRGARNGKPKFNAVERYIYGTPAWWKVQNGVLGAHAADGVQEGLSGPSRHDRRRPGPATR